MENILVGAIILAAAAFAVYRLFFRPSCGCGSGCNCASRETAAGKKAQNSSCCGKGDQCGCGK